jgi:hypothetical protein
VARVNSAGALGGSWVSVWWACTYQTVTPLSHFWHRNKEAIHIVYYMKSLGESGDSNSLLDLAGSSNYDCDTWVIQEAGQAIG